jgi:hypothetical protein
MMNEQNNMIVHLGQNFCFFLVILVICKIRTPCMFINLNCLFIKQWAVSNI